MAPVSGAGQRVVSVRGPEGRTVYARQPASPATGADIDNVRHRFLHYIQGRDLYRLACKDEWLHRSDFTGDPYEGEEYETDCKGCFP